MGSTHDLACNTCGVFLFDCFLPLLRIARLPSVRTFRPSWRCLILRMVPLLACCVTWLWICGGFTLTVELSFERLLSAGLLTAGLHFCQEFRRQDVHVFCCRSLMVVFSGLLPFGLDVVCFASSLDLNFLLFSLGALTRTRREQVLSQSDGKSALFCLPLFFRS